MLFCGIEFSGGEKCTREALKPFPHVQLDVCPREQVPEKISGYDMCVVRMSQLSASVLANAKRLKFILQFGVGLEGVDIQAATEAGIKVARIPSEGTGNALACAEHALYLVIGLLRDQKGMAQAVTERRLGEPLGETLYGKTVLIIGYGGIGRELALRLSVFGVHILVIRSVEGVADAGLPSYIHEVGGPQQLPGFARRADVVFTCCTLTSKTKGIVDAKLLAVFKKGARLVNVARGGLLDYKAVRAALESGHLGGLGLDVAWYEPFDPDDPLLQLSNVLITPHVAGVTDMSYRSMGRIVADCAQQLHKGFSGMQGVQFVN